MNGEERPVSEPPEPNGVGLSTHHAAANPPTHCKAMIGRGGRRSRTHSHSSGSTPSASSLRVRARRGRAGRRSGTPVRGGARCGDSQSPRRPPPARPISSWPPMEPQRGQGAARGSAGANSKPQPQQRYSTRGVGSRVLLTAIHLPSVASVVRDGTYLRVCGTQPIGASHGPQAKLKVSDGSEVALVRMNDREWTGDEGRKMRDGR